MFASFLTTFPYDKFKVKLAHKLGKIQRGKLGFKPMTHCLIDGWSNNQATAAIDKKQQNKILFYLFW